MTSGHETERVYSYNPFACLCDYPIYTGLHLIIFNTTLEPEWGKTALQPVPATSPLLQLSINWASFL